MTLEHGFDEISNPQMVDLAAETAGDVSSAQRKTNLTHSQPSLWPLPRLPRARFSETFHVPLVGGQPTRFDFFVVSKRRGSLSRFLSCLLLNKAGGEVLADHGDGTFTVKYANGQTEDDVPRECVRATAATARKRSGRGRSASQSKKVGRVDSDDAGRGGGDVWLAVERMASELAKREGVERKKVPPSSLGRQADEVQFGWVPPVRA